MTTHVYTESDVERAAKALGGARKNSSGWECRCPCHDDRKASLTLSLGDGGKLLWRCHAGCDQGDVLDALRKAGVLQNGDARKAEPAGRPRIVKTYDYTDEDG